MWIVIAILIIVMLAAGIVYLSTTTSPNGAPQNHYLGQIAGLFEGALGLCRVRKIHLKSGFLTRAEFRYQDVEIAEFRHVATAGI